MTRKVFLSYANQDRDFAESIKPELTAILSAGQHEIDVFDVQSDLNPGEDWRQAIKSAIDDASTVVIVSSPASDTSQWVNYEAGMADALGKDIVIVGREGMAKSALADRFQDSARFIEICKER